MDMLGSAQYIYTFNCMQFDLQQFTKQCGLDIMTALAAKMVDPKLESQCWPVRTKLLTLFLNTNFCLRSCDG